MENKSLNVWILTYWIIVAFFLKKFLWIFYYNHAWNAPLQIFNSKLVLASPETASDADYAAILGVIGHEVCYHY